MKCFKEKELFRSIALILAMITCLADGAKAEDSTASDNAAQANNPLANFTAFNLQNYYIGEFTEPDRSGNQFWARFATPFSIGKSLWLMRASLPVNTYPVMPAMDHQTGLGDLNVFAAYLIDTGNPALSFGVGPQLTLPTATDDALGSGKWSAGLVNTLYNASSKRFQYGYLLSWQGSFAGSTERPDVNVASFQPFGIYQLGSGTYLRSSAVSTYNIENSTYSFPLGFGIGKVLPTEKVIYNIFIEPQVSIADKGAGWPKWQIYFALNLQFK